MKEIIKNSIELLYFREKKIYKHLPNNISKLIYQILNKNLVLKILLETCYFNNNQICLLFTGSHIILNDNGIVYNILKNKSTIQFSTHGKSYTYDNLLFGKNNGKTWIQLENHEMNNEYNINVHNIDNLLYIIINKQIGKYGFSKYTDKNPLYINIINSDQLIYELNNLQNYKFKLPVKKLYKKNINKFKLLFGILLYKKDKKMLKNMLEWHIHHI